MPRRHFSRGGGELGYMTLNIVIQSLWRAMVNWLKIEAGSYGVLWCYRYRLL